MKQHKTKQTLFVTIFTLFFVIVLSVDTATALTVTNTDNNGTGSLRAAITMANSTTADDVIDFNIVSCPNGVCTITLTSGELTINAVSTAGKLTILGSGNGNAVISGNNASRIFFVKAGADLTLDRITITAGYSQTSSGSGIRVEPSSINQSKLTITNSIITGSAGVSGNGITNSKNGVLTVTNSTISNNNNGGISNDFGATMIVTDSTFSGNRYYPAILNGGTAMVTNSTISNNSGGGIGNGGGGTLTLANSIVSNNTAVQDGGGISNGSNGTVTINNSTVSGNVAPQKGGGIYNTGSYGSCSPSISTAIIITNSSISGNRSQMGGGIYSTGNSVNCPATLRMTNSSVSNNTATQEGGGIYRRFDMTTTITNSTVSNNTAQLNGGGIYNYGNTITMTNSTISGNTTAQNGGGIAHLYGTLTMTNSTVSNNSAQLTGGGLYVGPSSVLRNSVIAANIGLGGQSDVHSFSSFGTSYVTSYGNNLIGDANDTGTTVVWQASDILNQSPRLAPLGNHGGATQTHALLNNSPAINAGNNCVLTVSGCGTDDPSVALTTDQRGVGRVSTVDIGAFESNNTNAATLPSGNTNSPNYYYFLARYDNSNGNFTYSATGLPAGLSIQQTSSLAPAAIVTVAIVGTPTASGNFTPAITVTDSNGNSYTTNYTLTIFAPTAASVTVSGRVLTGKRGLRNARVTMISANGLTRTAVTGTFGYYRFVDVPAGETYIFSVSAKRYTFSQQTQVRSITEDTDNVNFVADN